MIRFLYGLLLGALAGGALALLLFAEPLCRSGVRDRVAGLLGQLGVKDSGGLAELFL